MEASDQQLSEGNRMKFQDSKLLLGKARSFFVLSIALFLFFLPNKAHARMVDNVEITVQPDGYRIIIDFLFSLRYQSHIPDEASREFRVQLRPVNFQSLNEEDVGSLRERVPLSWDYTTGIPLEEIIFEGGDPTRPQISFLFSREVEFSVLRSVDPETLVFSIKVEKPVPVEPEEEIAIPKEVVTDDSELAKLMKEAREAMIKSENSRAVQLYTKVLRTAKGDVKKQALEMLGLARERNGQVAHAKAEYQKYLEEYPDGPDADRVRQRLAGLVTATKLPKRPLGELLPFTKRIGKWDTRYYGRLSQFYFYDQITPEGGEKQVNRRDFRTDLDFNSRWRNDDYDMLFQYVGSYVDNLLSGPEGGELSKVSFSLRDKKNNSFGKIGRQTRNSGGVLGRFDGVHLAHDINPYFTINGVFGYPVVSSRQMRMDSDRKFYSVSTDFGTSDDKLDFTTFFIEQENQGITDRQSIGGEVRYFDPQKSFFNLIDYDIMFKELNIFMFNGYWNFSPKTTFNFILDYRMSPLLTTNNAIQGQFVGDISDLFGIYTDDELKQLAKDRSAVSKAMTFGITRELKEDVQLTGEVTLSELEGTETSGGVEGMSGTGIDAAYLIQTIFSNAFVENDVVITGFRYADIQSSDIYSFDVNCRFPYKKKLRLIPRLRFDYRDSKSGTNDRITLRSSLRFDYKIQEWMRLDVESGVQWMDYKNSSISQRSTELFLSAALHIYF
jgi:hypothetical protein